MEKIENEQKLLEEYYQFGLSVIGEFSHSIAEETETLKEIVKDYAERHGLSTDFLDE